MPEISLEMRLVAALVWVARVLTSLATTAKPRPASPARADSMVALSASRLIWPATSAISLMTSSIAWAAWRISPVDLSAAWVRAWIWSTACLVRSMELAISATEAFISSAAAATVSTLPSVSSAASTARERAPMLAVMSDAYLTTLIGRPSASSMGL